MRKSRAIRIPMLVIALGTAIAACSTTTYHSFRPVENRNVDIAYIGDNADFSQYSRLMFEDMGIFYPSHSNASEADVDRVRSAFRTAFAARVSDYEITDKPAADVLTVTASLVDLRHGTFADIPRISYDINQIMQPGKLTFMIEMRDSRSDTVLLRAADTSRSPELDLPEDGSADLSEVTAAAEHWADLFGNFLDTNLRGAD